MKSIARAFFIAFLLKILVLLIIRGFIIEMLEE
jgi:hypothetical protein